MTNETLYVPVYDVWVQALTGAGLTRDAAATFTRSVEPTLACDLQQKVIGDGVGKIVEVLGRELWLPMKPAAGPAYTFNHYALRQASEIFQDYHPSSVVTVKDLQAVLRLIDTTVEDTRQEIHGHDTDC